MRLTTFFWNNSPVDLHLISGEPHPLDFTGQSLFGFDALQIMMALGDINEYDLLVINRFFSEHGAFPGRFAEKMMATFPANVVLQSVPVAVPICVSAEALMSIEDILPAHERIDWVRFVKDILRVMRSSCLYLRDTLEAQSYTAQEEDDNGNLISKRIYPSIPIRVLLIEMQRMIAFGAYEPQQIGIQERELTEYMKQHSQEFVSESKLPLALKAISGKEYTSKEVRNLLVKTGYLSAVNRNQYTLSSIGIGYGVEVNNERHWHISFIKLLEANQ